MVDCSYVYVTSIPPVEHLMGWLKISERDATLLTILCDTRPRHIGLIFLNDAIEVIVRTGNFNRVANYLPKLIAERDDLVLKAMERWD